MADEWKKTITIVLKTYDRENKIIVSDITEGDKTFYNREKHGMTPDEFKKFIREKYPNAIIENNIAKERAVKNGVESDTPQGTRDREFDRDIKKMMRNDWSD